jgi:medium-chain acyl-[acyl-carrier-protein] hydrolase
MNKLARIKGDSVKTKLFCLPYAGGTSSMLYGKWKRIQTSQIEVIPVELSGRGKRVEGPLYTNSQDIVRDIFESIEGEIKDSSFAFFGHSMGSLLAYELYYLMFERGCALPAHIFFSGGVAPHVYRNQGLYLLPDKKFFKLIKKYGGAPEIILQNEELRSIYAAILKADFQAMDTYRFTPREAKIDCDISILYGKKDKGVSKGVSGWNEYTNQTCQMHTFDGDHFYLHDHSLEIIKLIDATLQSKVIR